MKGRGLNDIRHCAMLLMLKVRWLSFTHLIKNLQKNYVFLLSNDTKKPSSNNTFLHPSRLLVWFSDHLGCRVCTDWRDWRVCFSIPLSFPIFLWDYVPYLLVPTFINLSFLPSLLHSVLLSKHHVLVQRGGPLTGQGPLKGTREGAQVKGGWAEREKNK